MGWGLCTVAGVAGKGETLDIVPRYLITGRRVAGSSFGGVKGRDGVPHARRALARGRHRRRVVRLAPHHARRGEPRLRADGGAGRDPERDLVLHACVERAEHPELDVERLPRRRRRRRARRARRLERRRGAAARRRSSSAEITITHVLVTHQHGDHVVDPAAASRKRFGVPVVGSALTKDAGRADRRDVRRRRRRSTRASSRSRRSRRPATAPTTSRCSSNGTDCLTADCLFKGTVGGTMGGGPTGYADQVNSIMNRLMKLPPETNIHPGHTLPSTIGDEWERNPFIRIWRGLDPEGTEQCRVRGEQATLILLAPDYDGTNKALGALPGRPRRDRRRQPDRTRLSGASSTRPRRADDGARDALESNRGANTILKAARRRRLRAERAGDRWR